MYACKLHNCLGHHDQKNRANQPHLVIGDSTLSPLFSLLPPLVHNMHHEEQQITSVA